MMMALDTAASDTSDSVMAPVAAASRSPDLGVDSWVRSPRGFTGRDVLQESEPSSRLLQALKRLSSWAARWSGPDPGALFRYAALADLFGALFVLNRHEFIPAINPDRPRISTGPAVDSMVWPRSFSMAGLP
jgi:hypothetical protein